MRKVLGVNVAVSNYDEVVEKSVLWAKQGESRAIFFAAVHMLMETHDRPSFCSEMNDRASLNPDGMPLVWALWALGERDATRIYGPDATERLLQASQDSDIPVGFLGGSQSTLNSLVAEVQRRYPTLKIVYTLSPPFRPLQPAEDEEIVRQISESGARMLFVGLGCPKQEQWIMAHLGQIPAVMLGVGAAFDFLAGTKKQAPRWMMRNGLEWVYRFASEPRRLGGRYLKHNPRFIALFFRQWLTEHGSRAE